MNRRVAHALQLCRGNVERFSHRERRFLATLAQAASVLDGAARHLHLAVYDTDRPVAYARTLYLDGPGLTDGSRLRIRQYAAAAGADAPVVTSSYLEYKRRHGEQRDKVRVTAPAAALADLLAGRNRDDWRARLRVVPELRDVVDGLAARTLEPRLMTWYRRLSLAGTGIRMTMDHDVTFSLPEPLCGGGSRAEPERAYGRLAGVLIEVKSAEELPGWLVERTHALAEAPPSKFEAGMAALADLDDRRQVA